MLCSGAAVGAAAGCACAAAGPAGPRAGAVGAGAAGAAPGPHATSAQARTTTTARTRASVIGCTLPVHLAGAVRRRRGAALGAERGRGGGVEDERRLVQHDAVLVPRRRERDVALADVGGTGRVRRRA